MRARARAAADAVALKTDRRRLPFDEFIAKASCALDGRSLADLDDSLAYDLLLDAVAEVMQPRFMVGGRATGLALFRRCVEAWPTTTLVRRPDMLFREFWWKAEKVRLGGGRISAWGYFSEFVDEMLTKYSQERFDAEAAIVGAQIRAATMAPMPAAQTLHPDACPTCLGRGEVLIDLSGSGRPNLRWGCSDCGGTGRATSKVVDAEFATVEPVPTETTDQPFLAPADRDDAAIAEQEAWRDQRNAVKALEAKLGERAIAKMLDDVRDLGMPFGEPVKSWGKAGVLRGRQCLLNRLVKAERRGLDWTWLWLNLVKDRDNPKITARNWTGVGEILDAALTRIDAERQQKDGSHAQVENRPI